MRLRGLVIAPLVLAGCAGGGHAAPKPHGVYEAHVTVGGAERTVWLDLTAGRFRVSTPSGHRRIVTVSDGHAALTLSRGITSRTTGSPGFLVATADPGVAALRDRLLGRGAPSGTTITGFHRVDAPSRDLFVVVGGAVPAFVIRQVQVGAIPPAGPHPYWLGERFRGQAPRYASASTSKAGSSYDIAYPRIDVQVESPRFRVPTCGTTPIALADGTPARVAVVPEQIGSCDGGVDAITFATTSATPGGLAIVLTGHRTILLSGPAVSAKTAAAIARALRPV
ncbi:MAG TPA: hypothetical protein VH459_00040 [Gaiellales bacterium]